MQQTRRSYLPGDLRVCLLSIAARHLYLATLSRYKKNCARATLIRWLYMTILRQPFLDGSTTRAVSAFLPHSQL